MKRSMLVLSVVVMSLLCSCNSPTVSNKEFGDAQKIVDQIAASHPEIVRLTIHAVPKGKTGSKIIACNIAEKIGKLSDPEDIDAMKTGKTTVLKEGENLDVTAPVFDKSGKAIAATGITLSFSQGQTEESLSGKARIIAQELTSSIQGAGKDLW